MKQEQNANIFLRVGIAIILILYFFIVYFFIGTMEHQNAIDGLMFVDEIIPFIPFFIIFYIIGDALFYAPLLFMKTKRELYWTGLNYFFILSASFIFFWLLPIQVIKPAMTGTDLFTKITLMRIGLDTAYNAFPSLHVSLSVYAWYLFRQINKKWSAYLLPIFALVIISTVLVKQHIFIDVLGGLTVGTLFSWVHSKYLVNKK
jgi:membrane-associated phospholipid phosphatase